MKLWQKSNGATVEQAMMKRIGSAFQSMASLFSDDTVAPDTAPQKQSPGAIAFLQRRTVLAAVLLLAAAVVTVLLLLNRHRR